MSAARLLVPPDLMRKLDELEIRTRRSFAGRIRGEQRSVKKGHSLEFADYRSYIQGDDLRFIDWKIFARLDRLFLKLFMEEEDLFVYILLDTSHSMGMGEPAKLPYAKQLAAALSYIALSGTHRVAIQPYAADVLAPLPPTRGKGQFAGVSAFLERLEAEGQTDSRTGIAHFRRRLRGSGVVFLISDLLDRNGTVEALKPLLAGRYEVCVFHLLAPDEEEPQWEGDWRLVDVEDGGTVGVSMSARLREAYGKAVRQFRGEQRDVCGRYGFNYLPIRSDLPLESLVLHSLRARGVLK